MNLPDHTQWDIENVLIRLGWDGDDRARGKWTDIRCPFHDDRNIGNAGFNSILNIFKCQACGAAGNSVTLVMQQLGKNASEAVKWLGEDYVTPVRRPTEDERMAKWRRY